MAAFLFTVLVVEYFVIPQLPGLRDSLRLLGGVNDAYVLLAVAAEAGAIWAYAQMTRAVLPSEIKPSAFTIARVQVATAAVSKILPGGTAAGAALGYRLLTSTGASGTDVGFALATQSVGSGIVLNLLLWTGLIISLPTRGFTPLYGTAAIIGIALIGLFSVAVLLLTRGEDRAARVFCSLVRPLPFIDQTAVDGIVRRLAVRVRALLGDGPLLVQVATWGVINWLCDAGSLWLFVAAFGHHENPAGLLVAFGLANVLSAVPITPGGIGVIEAVMIPTLIAFGAPSAAATLGVLTYRLVQFWLIIPVGAISYVTLKRGEFGRRERAREVLRELAEQSLDESETRRHWAERHGVHVPSRHHPAVQSRATAAPPPPADTDS